MGMFNNLKDIVKVFRFDEQLLRLLYYPPKDIVKNVKDPLDDSLPNVLDIDADWQIRDRRIMLIPKAEDLVEESLCRIYLYAGRRRPTKNYQVASQEVIVDILCHNSFEKDLRSMKISDRINDLLVDESITGISKIDYVDGDIINAPADYVGYRHVYVFGSVKK